MTNKHEILTIHKSNCDTRYEIKADKINWKSLECKVTLNNNKPTIKKV